MTSKALVMAVGFLLASCAARAVDRYAVSMDAHSELKQMAAEAPGTSVAIGPFTASEPGRTEFACRLVGPIMTPDGESFEAFVRKALIDQLRLAEIYSTEATSSIRGNLDFVSVDTVYGAWKLSLTLSDDTGRSFAVQESYKYRGGFYETVCETTAQSFMPAVQNLIRKVVSHPEFKEMIEADG